MLVYRITLEKYSASLAASGRAARWNSNDVKMIYASSSRALACLENVVHRNQLGLNQQFKVLEINIPSNLEVAEIKLTNLVEKWADFNYMHLTQAMGNDWIKQSKSPVLKVPSSIIAEENNYLLNPQHASFAKIKIVSVSDFVFDNRIKRG